MLQKIRSILHPSRAFTFLVVFRWASLFPALLTLSSDERQNLLPPVMILGVAALANVIISIFISRLNKLVIDHPIALGLDLLFCAAVLAGSGGSQSPYYLYALSPLLAGAFFFQLRGAWVTAAVFTPFYLASDFIAHPLLDLQISKSVTLLTQLVGIWLIPILFAYPAALLKVINQAREELSGARDQLAEKHENLTTAHRQLRVIHDLTVLLQAAPDLISVQQRVLGAVTTGLGYRRAIVGLVDPT
jgi:hypothetical protein